MDIDTQMNRQTKDIEPDFPTYRQLYGWLVVLGFNATLIAKVISWQSVTHMLPGFLTPILTQLFFPKPLTSFLTCFCRGERRKHTQKNLGSNSLGHDSDTLTTEPPEQGNSSMDIQTNPWIVTVDRLTSRQTDLWT